MLGEGIEAEVELQAGKDSIRPLQNLALLVLRLLLCIPYARGVEVEV